MDKLWVRLSIAFSGMVLLSVFVVLITGVVISALMFAWKKSKQIKANISDADGVSRACVALLSDWFPQTTGEIVHVDGGFHAMGV